MACDSAPAAAEKIPDPKRRLADFVITAITPPVAQSETIGQWAGFLHLMRADEDMRATHRNSYITYRDTLELLIAAVLPQMPTKALRQASIACVATIDGLWLEASLISDSFEADEIAAVGLSAVGAILGIELTLA